MNQLRFVGLFMKLSESKSDKSDLAQVSGYELGHLLPRHRWAKESYKEGQEEKW